MGISDKNVRIILPIPQKTSIKRYKCFKKPEISNFECRKNHPKTFTNSIIITEYLTHCFMVQICTSGRVRVRMSNC